MKKELIWFLQYFTPTGTPLHSTNSRHGMEGSTHSSRGWSSQVSSTSGRRGKSARKTISVVINSLLTDPGRKCGLNLSSGERNPSIYMRRHKQTLCLWRTALEPSSCGSWCSLAGPWGKSLSCLTYLSVLKLCTETIHRYLIEWLSYWIRGFMCRIEEESRATLKPSPSQQIQLRPLSPVSLILVGLVEE